MLLWEYGHFKRNKGYLPWEFNHFQNQMLCVRSGIHCWWNAQKVFEVSINQIYVLCQHVGGRTRSRRCSMCTDPVHICPLSRYRRIEQSEGTLEFGILDVLAPYSKIVTASRKGICCRFSETKLSRGHFAHHSVFAQFGLRIGKRFQGERTESGLPSSFLSWFAVADVFSKSTNWA